MQKRDVSVNSCPWQPDGNGQLPGRRNGTAAAVLPLQLPPGTSAPECGAALFCVRPRAPTGCPPCGASSLSCRSSRGAVSLRSAGGTVVSVTWDPRPQPARACVSPCTGPTRCCCARAQGLSVGHVTWVRSARVCVCVRAVTFSAWSGGEAFHQSRYSRATRLCTLPPSWHSSAFCV